MIRRGQGGGSAESASFRREAYWINIPLGEGSAQALHGLATLTASPDSAYGSNLSGWALPITLPW